MLLCTKMTREQKFLPKVLRAYLYNESCDLAGLDIQNLCTVSKQHNLAPIVFSVIKDVPQLKENKGLYNQMQDLFYDAIVRYDMQSAIKIELEKLFIKNNIKHAFFKGSVINQYFPVPELRLMGDIDVLISEADRDNVKKLMVADDFELINFNGPVYDYKKDDVLIEVHTKIISGKVGSSNAEEFFKNAIDNCSFDGCKGSLDVQYHFEYLITHIAHHFWFYGAGAKLILDLAVFAKNFDIDFDLVVENLGKINLDKFAKIIITICHKWFGVGKKYDVFTDETEEFLLSFGAFGNANRNKAMVVRRKALEEGRKTGFGAKLGLLFPPYEKMKNIPYMKFMEGRAYLLPAGWIYRIVYNVKNRKELLNDATASLGSEKTKNEAMAELMYFEEIGLI